MARGGARNRSGPVPAEGSARSEARGYSLTALPAEGFDGEPPAWPLTAATRRELDVWREVWRTPQACAWSLPSEAWRARTVAMWVRVSVRCEKRDAPATLFEETAMGSSRLFAASASKQSLCPAACAAPIPQAQSVAKRRYFFMAALYVFPCRSAI